jgi:uncharacterized protein
MLSASLLVAALAAFSAAILSGVTGFGLAVKVVPLLMLLYDPKTVVALTGVLSLTVAAAVVHDSRREADHRVALALLAAALPGLWAGAEVLQVVDPSYVQLGMGVLVVVAALLLGRDVRLPGAKTRCGPVLVDSVSGALASSTGLSAPPAALLLASRGLRKRPFRATISFYFLGLVIALLTVLALRGLVDASGLAPLALFLMAATVVGRALGTKLLERIAAKAFRVVVLATVVLADAMGVATATRALLC